MGTEEEVTGNGKGRRKGSGQGTHRRIGRWRMKWQKSIHISTVLQGHIQFVHTCDPNCPVALIRVGWSLRLGNMWGRAVDGTRGGMVSRAEPSRERMNEWQRSIRFWF